MTRLPYEGAADRLAEIIRGDIKDPRISPLTSVVAVEVAPDLKQEKAWI